MREGWVFVLSGDVDLPVGALGDVYRRTGRAEIPLALARIESKNSSGAFQAVPVGKLNPIHVKEHSAGGLRSSDLVVRAHVDLSRIKEVIDDIR